MQGWRALLNEYADLGHFAGANWAREGLRRAKVAESLRLFRHARAGAKARRARVEAWEASAGIHERMLGPPDDL